MIIQLISYMYCKAGKFANASGNTVVIGLPKRIMAWRVVEFWKAYGGTTEM